MSFDAWTEAFSAIITNFWSKVASFAPNILATVIIVTVGIYFSRLIAKALSVALSKLGVDRLCEEINLTHSLKAVGIESPPSRVLASLFHLFLVLLIVLTAVDTLGLQRVSSVIDEFVLYLPKMLGAIAVVVGGMFLGHHFRSATANTLKHFGINYAQAVSQVVYGIIMLITASLAINQLQIATDLLDIFFIIIMASVGLACAISFGMGARDVSAQLISGVYLREQLIPGEELCMDGKFGTVLSVGTVNTLVQIDNEVVRIPNTELLSKKFSTRSDDADEE
jgi:hypothetical protein